MTLPEPVSAPSRPEPDELLEVYAAHLQARGRRVWNNAIGPARRFLRRWPDPQAFAKAPLANRLGLEKQMHGFVIFLMVGGWLRPGYDYLLCHKLTRFWRDLEGTSVGTDLERFAVTAEQLGFGERSRIGTASQAVGRILL